MSFSYNILEQGACTGPFINKYGPGCADGCKKFSSLQLAENACRSSSTCKAVTKQGCCNVYELRANANFGNSPSQEISWDCSSMKFNCEKFMIVGRFLELCRGPYPNKYGPGCADGCKRFSTLADAEKACKASSACKVVTKRGGSGNIYELRANANLGNSPSGETSWDCTTVATMSYFAAAESNIETQQIVLGAGIIFTIIGFTAYFVNKKRNDKQEYEFIA